MLLAKFSGCFCLGQHLSSDKEALSPSVHGESSLPSWMFTQAPSPFSLSFLTACTFTFSHQFNSYDYFLHPKPVSPVYQACHKEHHRLGGLHKTNRFYSSCGGCKFKVKVSAVLVSSVACLLGLRGGKEERLPLLLRIAILDPSMRTATQTMQSISLE